jgi:predicted DNA-binding protein
VHQYLPVFIFLYEQNGVRVTPQEITEIVYHNYPAFLERQNYFEDFLRNFSLIIETVGNSKIIRSEFKEHYMAEIARKLGNQNSHPHERCVSFVETREMKELKLSKKFFKLGSKWFNNRHYPTGFRSNYEIKYHLEHLSSRMAHSSSHLLRDSTHLDQHMITTNFREEFYLNYKSLDRIRIEIITSIISPKSKKNIYFTNKIERFKSYLHFWTSYYHFK